MACEAEVAVHAIYNLERARTGPLEEMAHLLHRRPKPPVPDTAAASTAAAGGPSFPFSAPENPKELP